MSQPFSLGSAEAGRILRHLPGGQDAQTPAIAPPTGISPSLMYEPYYGLKEKPFSLSAEPRFLFKSSAHAPAFDELLHGIRRREGLITLTGEIGTGKTTLIRSVLQSLDRRTFSAFVPDPFVSREDLLKMLLVDFGVISIADLKRGSLNGASRPDLSYPLYEFLDSLVPLQAFAVLIIDEAQNLPLPLLEEIRILSDLEGREKLLQVVLVGQPELRSHLKLPEMRQVDQRVSVRCELAPLTSDGVAGYIAYRLGVAGDGQSRVEFSEAAIDAVYKASHGTPRLINLVCDRALHRAYVARVDRIEPSFIWDATKDLGLEPPADEVATAMAAFLPADTDTQTQTLAPPPALAPLPEISKDTAPPVLSDFEPESLLRAQSSAVPPQTESSWKRVAGFVFAMLIVVAVGSFVYLYSQVSASDISAITLPSSPKKIPPTFVPRPLPDESAVLTVPKTATPSAVASAGENNFTIQVASFESQARATRLVEELRQAGYHARAAVFEIGVTGDRLLQIRIDGYRTLADAERDLARVREMPGYADARILTR